ncbi:hypothetical protein BU16DRAFT_169669 [Lophium mytilinum]|uniref:Uncharacterized protein n=1 Tax=Lophium mytilinum TaxID=390894 RepID=A0A6A6QF17_9PEZI|nr:hypothetical protein BU16DRAFT_169669 [Lophium mytilinum]
MPINSNFGVWFLPTTQRAASRQGISAWVSDTLHGRNTMSKYRMASTCSLPSSTRHLAIAPFTCGACLALAWVCPHPSPVWRLGVALLGVP